MPAAPHPSCSPAHYAAKAAAAKQGISRRDAFWATVLRKIITILRHGVEELFMQGYRSDKAGKRYTPPIMFDPAELQHRQQEDEEFRKEFEKRKPEIQERSGNWQDWAFGVSWLLAISGWAILATREHGSKIAFGIILAILLGTIVLYGEAERIITSLVSDDIQEKIERGRSR